MSADDATFLAFAWLCLAGPLLLLGFGMLLKIGPLLDLAHVLLGLLTILDPSQGGVTHVHPQELSFWARLPVALVLLLLGAAAGAFFTANVGPFAR